MVKKYLVGLGVAVSGLIGSLALASGFDVSSYTGPNATDTLAMANGSIGVVWANLQAILPVLITFAVVITLIFGAIYFVLRRLHILR